MLSGSAADPDWSGIRILTLDAAFGRCSAGLVVDDACLQFRRAEGGYGTLAELVEEVTQGGLDLVAVTLGPGSFTGLRATIALAHGIALGSGIPVIGVTVAEALAEELAQGEPALAGRALWVAIDSRRNRVFLQREGAMTSVELDHLPSPNGPVAIAGDAAKTVACRLAAAGHDVMLTHVHAPMPRPIAAVARRRAAGALSTLPVLPVYVDPPAARESAQRAPPVA